MSRGKRKKIDLNLFQSCFKISKSPFNHLFNFREFAFCILTQKLHDLGYKRCLICSKANIRNRASFLLYFEDFHKRISRIFIYVSNRLVLTFGR